MDEQVPIAITRGLRGRGIEVLTAQEDGHQEVADALVLDRATALRLVVFTRDDDFLVEAHRRQLTGAFFAGVVYAHQLSVSIGGCVTDLEIIALCAHPNELENRVLYLPLTP